MKLTVTIEDPTPEVLAALSSIKGAAVVNMTKTEEKKTETKKPDGKKVEEKTGEGEVPTFERLREIVVEKTQAEKGKQIKELYTKYGCTKLSDMDKAYYADFFMDIKKI